jgi:hypothetical protein
MVLEKPDAVSIGAHIGGKDAYAVVKVPNQKLKNLIHQYCLGPYSNSLTEFGLVLRIDGALDAWGKTGVENIKLLGKKTRVQAEVYIPRSAWDGSSDIPYSKYICAVVRGAISDCVDHVEKRGVNVTRQELFSDLDKAIEEFLDNE